MIEYLVTFIFLAINLVACILAYKVITGEKIKFNFKIYFFLIIIVFLFKLTNILFINLILNILVIIIYINSMYSVNIKKSIYYSIIISILSLLCDAIISLILSSKYLENFIVYQHNLYFRSMLSIPSCIFFLIICNIKFIKKIINIFFEKFLSKIKFNKITNLFIILTIILLILSFCYNAYDGAGRIGHSVIVFGIISFSFIFVFALYIAYHEFQIEQINKKIIEENNYIKSIARQDEEFKHNLINNLLGIKTVSNKKTNKLIDELINDYRQDYKNITNINDLPNGVQSIIYKKAYEENIEDLNLIVDNSIKKELYDYLSPKKYNHLCTSIGILFDNALQAVKNNYEKIIEINLIEDKDNIYFILKNSFSNIIDLEDIGKRNVSTKINGHGIGMNYISNLRTLKIKNEIINNMFISKLKVKKSKKI